MRRYSLIGYHCTKLTSEEIVGIRNNGMLLQNAISLNERIDSLHERKMIDNQIAQRLKSENQADDYNRANMLWFCFYEPYIAGQYGIERFFRSWGGEALYNSHEDGSDSGAALLGIGMPCIFRVKVPMKSLEDSYLPDSAIISTFLLRRGHHIENPIVHEGFSTENIPSQNIIEIIEYPDDRFIELTKCDTWVTSPQKLKA